MPFLFNFLRMSMNQIVDVTQNTLTATPSVITYSHDEIKNMFDELHSAFQNAETWAKRVENIIDDVPIAAINQMRYAGYHISKVLSKSNFFPKDNPNQSLVNIDDLRSAYKHLLRAYFDSLDQLTQQIAAQLSDYESKFQDLNIVVTDHFPEFFNWLDSVHEIGQFDISTDTNSINQFAISKNDRETHYQKIVDKIEELETIQKQFRAIANCIIVQARKIDDENKKFSFSKIGVIGTVIGVTLTLLGLIVAVITLWISYPKTESTIEKPTENPSQQIQINTKKKEAP